MEHPTRLDERLVDDELRHLVRKAGSFPGFDLFPHWLEVPLHAVYFDGEDVHEVQVRVCFASSAVNAPKIAKLRFAGRDALVQCQEITHFVNVI